MIILNNLYSIGELVYLKTDPEQNARQIIAVEIRVGDVLVYSVMLGSSVSCHYEIELAKEKSLESLSA